MSLISEIKQTEINRRRAWIFLFLILLLGAMVRYWNIDFALDLKDYKTSITWAKIDEETALNCIFGTLFYGDLNLHDFIYPSFYRYLLFFFYCLFFIPKATVTKTFILSLLQSQLVKNPSIFFLIARYISATAGVASIYLIYRLAKKVANRKVALASSLFLALSPLHIRESHFATIDVTLTFMILIALLFIIDIYQKGRLKDYLLSGFLVGLCISTKYNAIAVIIPLLAASLLRKKPQYILLLYSLLLMLLGFLLGTPYSALSPHEFLDGLTRQARLLYPHGFLHNFRGIFIGVSEYFEYFTQYK